MAKTRLFDVRNLRLSLKAVATGVVTSVVWIIPMFVASYLLRQLNLPIIGVIIGILSLVGYLYTWGFLSRRIFNIRD